MSYRSLISIKSDFRGVDVSTVADEQLIQTREQCLRLDIAEALQEGAQKDVSVGRRSHDSGPRFFCESMSSSK